MKALYISLRSTLTAYLIVTVSMATMCSKVSGQDFDSAVEIVLNKFVAYEQSSATEVKPIDPSGYSFLAYVVSAFPVSKAILEKPDGTKIALTNATEFSLSGLISASDFDSREELDAEFPNGDYGLEVTVGLGLPGLLEGTARISLTITNDLYPPIPKLMNFASAQQLPAAKGFTFEFPEFQAEFSQAILAVYPPIVLSAATNWIYSTTWNPTNPGTHKVIQSANQLQPDQSYVGRVVYDHYSMVLKTSITLIEEFFELPVLARSSYSSIVRFPIKTTSKVAQDIRINSEFSGTGNEARFVFESQPGNVYCISNSSDLKQWHLTFQTNATSQRVEWNTAKAASGPRQFYRVAGP